MSPIERPPAKIPELTDHIHEIDGFLFLLQPHSGLINATGWQGRFFQYRPGEESLLIEIIKKLPQEPSSDECQTKITVPRDDQSELTLNVLQNGLQISCQTEDLSILFSFSNYSQEREAICHILSEAKQLFTGNDPEKNHFCEPYGIENDD